MLPVNSEKFFEGLYDKIKQICTENSKEAFRKHDGARMNTFMTPPSEYENPNR
jgi:hypothetical protein